MTDNAEVEAVARALFEADEDLNDAHEAELRAKGQHAAADALGPRSKWDDPRNAPILDGFRFRARAAITAIDGVRARPRDISEPFDPTAGYPDPTPEMLDGDPLFDAIWNAIKRWDIARVPGAGYAGASGNDVRRIYDAVRAISTAPEDAP